MRRRDAAGLLLLVSSPFLACGPDRVENTGDAQVVETLFDSPEQLTSVATIYEAVPEPVEEETSALLRDVPSPEEGLAEYPEWSGYDLDCPDVGHPGSVPDADPHRLDRDNDGVGCEAQFRARSRARGEFWCWKQILKAA